MGHADQENSLGYSHRQFAPRWWRVLGLLIVVFFLAGAAVTFPHPACLLNLAFGVLFGALYGMDRWLEVADDGDVLVVRFGPLMFWPMRIKYADMRTVRRDRLVWCDNGGTAKWWPDRGWIYCIRGRDCVRIETVRQTVNIGTDDVENLLRHLGQRMAEHRPIQALGAEPSTTFNRP